MVHLATDRWSSGDSSNLPLSVRGEGQGRYGPTNPIMFYLPTGFWYTRVWATILTGGVHAEYFEGTVLDGLRFSSILPHLVSSKGLEESELLS